MKNQRNQVIALLVLVIGWAVYWQFFVNVPKTQVAAQTAAAKAAKADSLLQIRFRRIRFETDALYHYRIKPTAFDATHNAFRLPNGGGSGDAGALAADGASKPAAQDAFGPPTPDYAANLLKAAVASMRIGGVVTLNGTTQLTVDGELHKEGDEFTAKVLNSKGVLKSVLIKIKQLSTSSVTLLLDVSEGGGAEQKVRLN